MSSNDPNIKQVRVIPRVGATGDEEGLEDAVLEGGGQTRKRGGARGRGKAAKTYKLGSFTKEGGGAMSPGTVTQLSASHVPGATSAAAAAAALGVNSALTQKGAPVGGGGGGGAAKPAAQPAPQATTPAIEVKVVLAAPKKKGKVLLAAASAPKVTCAIAAPKTRKARGARKIRVSMSSLSKKIHRAKTIRHKATEDSIAEIKRTLHKAGLIKADSKAPEPVLRQMYADFMTLKNRAL